MRRLHPQLVLLGATIATISAICGIGGGLLCVPVLRFGCKLPLRSAVATGLGLVFCTSFGATLGEALRDDHHLQPSLIAVLLGGALVGTQLGYRVGKGLSTRGLARVFTGVLLVAGLRMLLAGGGEPGDRLEFDPGALEYVLAAAIGLGGGFLAPLLGVGGGLLMVPALFLGVPGLGYLGARAQSLAVSTVTSARSLWLYQREGIVDRARAVSLGLGAILGALIGVQLVHLEGGATVGRFAMAIILLVTAGRFAREAWAKPVPAGGGTGGRGDD